MSEYTNIYLRKKGEPLLKYRSLLGEETDGLTKEEYISLQEEVCAYNKAVSEGLGCELFYMGTTPSRQLQALPWSSDPQLLTAEMLKEVIDFYAEEIEEEKEYIKRYEEELTLLENRIRAADVKLYDKINQEIFDTKSYIKECQESLDELLFHSSRFKFIDSMMKDEDNVKNYELVYTKS